jgi:superfamily I DNA/RNA helicase
MSLWWARREQLDEHQVALIENLPLREKCLILGPPGSGKTNVLLRRAQFVRGQDMPNVLVLTFTRPLAEFIKTGCLDGGREIFPKSCVMTIESWVRWLYNQHKKPFPNAVANLGQWKRQLAAGARDFRQKGYVPQYHALFVDEAQDLMQEEVELLDQWSPVLFFVADSRQKLFKEAEGLDALRQVVRPLREHTLPFHYRVAPEICHMADQILTPQTGSSLESTCHYSGPRPATIDSHGPLPANNQLAEAGRKLKEQIRVYADLIQQGDTLGVTVARKEHRETVFKYFEQDRILKGKSKIIRAKDATNRGYDPSFEIDVPICVLTVEGCKGLEFRAVHWLFCEELSHYHDSEHYYTVVTRAKTSLDLYFGKECTRSE